MDINDDKVKEINSYNWGRVWRYLIHGKDTLDLYCPGRSPKTIDISDLPNFRVWDHGDTDWTWKGRFREVSVIDTSSGFCRERKREGVSKWEHIKSQLVFAT